MPDTLRAKLSWYKSLAGETGELIIEDPKSTIWLPKGYAPTGEVPIDAVVKFKLSNGALLWPLAGANHRICVSGDHDALNNLLSPEDQAALRAVQRTCRVSFERLNASEVADPDPRAGAYLNFYTFVADRGSTADLVRTAVNNLVNGPIYDWATVCVVDTV